MRQQDIEIPQPCHADWDQMRPEERGRYCFECKTKVHDLSAMTEAEAERFLAQTARQEVCIAYDYDEAGALVFRDPTPAPLVPLSRLRRRPSAAAAIMGATMAAALAACAPHGDPESLHHDPEVSVFDSPAVVIPHGEEPEAAPVPVPPLTEPDEPCGTEQAEPPTPDAKPVIRQVRGRRAVSRKMGKKPYRPMNEASIDPFE